jgi:hypothetical protein
MTSRRSFLVILAAVASKAVAAERGDSLTARCNATAKRLQSRLGDEQPILTHPPFVLGGDLPSETLANWYDETIRPAADAMANSYFQTAPTQPITVLLYSGKESYNQHIERLFGDRDISVYGYYKPQSRTLVMNIGTGGGTLVHELTHALIDFDFPAVPDWFDEGLASLHEQCSFRNGPHGPWIEGHENWRLAGLQKTIRAKRLRPLKAMIAADDFRGKLEGTNYAQARYFCLRMQRNDRLQKFYREFRGHHSKDPFGVATLERVLAISSWNEFDREFQRWVLTLG